MAGRLMKTVRARSILMVALMAGVAPAGIDAAFGVGTRPVTAEAGIGTADGFAGDAAPARSGGSGKGTAPVPLLPITAVPVTATPVTVTPAPAVPVPAGSAPVPGMPTPGAVLPGAASSGTSLAADPLAPLSAALAALLAEPGSGGILTSAREQEALSAFYAARDHAPLFMDQAGLAMRGKTVLARFARAEDEGLNPKDYALPKLPSGSDPAALARDELKLASMALRYARHAQAGRFDPEVRISALVTPARQLPDPLLVMSTLASAGDAGAALAAFNPPHAGFRALRAKLAEARLRPQAPTVHVPPGPTLRPGDQDARVSALRARLNVKAAPAGERVFDPGLAEAVRRFQAGNGLEPDGVVGAATVEILNRWDGSRSRVADIISNMERWRWLPRDLGTTHVMVNIPEYMVRIVDAGRVVFETRVIVGKAQTPTPLLSRDMSYAVINPYWNIPPNIARKEMLPNLQRDPYYLARQGIEITRGGRVVDPSSINWANGMGGFSFRQPPGERNALGRIKFMFPNDHSVYLHDTSAPRLFANEKRAFSHGCMRVQDPLSFGEVIFNLGMKDEAKGDDIWTQERIGKMFGGAERYLTFKRKIPVHVVYFTAWVDEAGVLRGRDDIYGIDARTRELLGLDGPQFMASGGPLSSTR